MQKGKREEQLSVPLKKRRGEMRGKGGQEDGSVREQEMERLSKEWIMN